MNLETKSKKERVIAPLGEFVELIRKQNKDLITDTLVGVDINKNLIEEKVKGQKTDLRTLQIVEKGYFVMSGMNTGRDKRVALALYMGERPLGASGSNKYYVFKVKSPKLKTEYLNLIFKSHKLDQMGLYFSGKGVRGELEWKNFSQIPISVPELEVQERIVDRYQIITKYVEVKKKINELLERKMKAYFHLLFDNLEEYTTKSFGGLFTIIGGGRPPRSNRYLEELYFCKGGGIPWLQVGDIVKQKCKFISHTSEQLTTEGFKKGRCTLLGGGHLLLIRSGSASNVGKLFVNNFPLCFDDSLWAIEFKFVTKTPFFLFLLSRRIQELLRISANSTSHKNLKMNKLLDCKVQFPPQHLIDKFNNFCEPIFELQKSNEQTIQKLSRLQKCWIECLD